MVILKEISEGIWGLKLGLNSTADVVTDRPVRLTMAALEIDEDDSASTSSGLTRVMMKSNTADNSSVTDLILCNLHYPSCLQQPLDLEFYDGQTLTFTAKGPYRVHLTGYFLQPDPQEMCEEGQDCCMPMDSNGGIFQTANDSSSEDDDEDDDDEDDDDDESDEEDLELISGHALDGDEEMDSDDSDDDEDEQEEIPAVSNKGKKRPVPEANNHANKKEVQTKNAKKTKTVKEEPAVKPDPEAKKAKNMKVKAEPETAKPTNDAAKANNGTPGEDRKTASGLEIKDLRVGAGPEAKLGKTAAVYYAGRLKSNNSTFDSCLKGKPFRFRLGAGEVIRGWDEGVKGMRVGGKRRLTIPPSLAYGSKKLPDIPANSTLVFDVELKNTF